MIKAGVIGDPISHSLSPKLHGFLLKKYGISGSYQAIKVTSDELENRVDSMLEEENFAGFNVTIPHKKAVFDLFQKKGYNLKPYALATQAVNTVYIDKEFPNGGKITGDNSDVFGFNENLLKSTNTKFIDWENKRAIILGAGGAASAAILGLLMLNSKKNNFESIAIINRNKEKAQNLISHYKNFFKEEFNQNINIEQIDKISESFGRECDILINTTSLGMKNQPELNINLSNLNKDAFVYDIVYNPLMTNLLKTAQTNGNKAVTGIGMLIYQAFLGFEKWYGIKPELTENEFNDLVKILI